MLRTIWDDVGRIVLEIPMQDLVGPVSGGLRVEGNERSFGQPGNPGVLSRIVTVASKLLDVTLISTKTWLGAP